MDFSYFLSRFWRRMHWFVLVAAAISGAAILVAREMPPTYDSQMRLLVEAPQIDGATVVENPLQQLDVMEQRLMTRANLLTIAREQNAFEDMRLMTPDEIVSAMRAGTSIGRPGGRNPVPLVTISFSGRSGPVAAGVLNSYLTIIQQEDVERRTVVAGQTLDFYDEEVERLSALLDDRSEAILSFQNANADALPSMLAARMRQQETLQDRLLQAERDLDSLERQREQLTRLFEASDGMSGLGGEEGGPSTPAERELDKLRSQLQSALAIYSDTNPRVRVLRSQIAQAEAAVAAEAALAAGIGSDPDADDVDPQQAQRQALFEAQMSELDARGEILVETRDSAQARLEEVGDVIDRIPANSISLSALEREYANVRAQYDSAVSRRSQAATGERIESLSRGQRIAVVEPPTVPSGPSGPDKVLIAGGGTAAGVFAGLALVVLMELLNGAPRRARDITAKLGVTPFATIPFVPTRRDTIRRRGVKIAIILIGLVGVPAALYAVHTLYRPLDLLVRDIAQMAGL